MKGNKGLDIRRTEPLRIKRCWVAPRVTILYKDYLRFHLAWIVSASREYPQIYKSRFASMVRNNCICYLGAVFSKFLAKKILALPLPGMDWFIYKQTLKMHLTLAHPFNTKQAEVIITNRRN